MAMVEAEAEAQAPRYTWAEAQAMQERLALIRQKIGDAKAKEERLALIKEYVRVASEVRDPDFSGMTEAERAAEAEKLRQEKLREARRFQMEGELMGQRRLEAVARIIDFDPKQRGIYYTRCCAVPLATFDLDEESPFGPMRYTDKVYKDKGDAMFGLCEAVNILSVKIACSDVGFPIHVYGTVIARDNLDCKCVYLYRRDRDHCQLINSEDESLILTGPKRGLTLFDDNYVEIDLKIKDHLGQHRELSKGVVTIRGKACRSLEKCVLETKSLATRLSTVDVMYAVVKCAVEATITVKVVQGYFYGKIDAYTTSIEDRIMLYDSKVAYATPGGHHGVIQLMRSVVSVYVMDLLIIDFQTDDGKSERILFTPRDNGGEEDQITVGATKMLVKVAWSMMNP